MKKNILNMQLIKLSGIVLIVIAGFSSCKKTVMHEMYDDPISVITTKVKKEKVAYYEATPGTVIALNEVELRSEVGGLVTGIFFKEGSFIHKGQKLYEIDRTEYQASYEQARANMDIAEANMKRAQRYVDRYTMLNKQDAIAKQKLDDALTDLRNAGLQLVSAKAGLVKARTDLSYSVIKAPFDGTIGISRVKMGTLVSPGQTLLNVISSDDPIGVDFDVNEKQLGRFRKIKNEDLTGNDSIFRIVLPDNSVYPANGKILFIDRAVDPQTATVTIRLVFPNPDGILKTGMSCDVNVLSVSSGERLVIPLKAVLEQMSESFVFVVDSQKVHQSKVELGAHFRGKVIVANGLTEGQQIVTEGVQKLRNDAKVNVVRTTSVSEHNKQRKLGSL